MKLKTFVAVAAVVLFAACGTPYRATDTAVVVAPDGTQQTFIAQYPTGSNAVWSRYDPNVVILNDWDLSGWQVLDANDYVVRFDMDNENYYAWYDSDGTWIGTAYVVRDHTSLPVAVNTTLTNQYPGHTISSINREFHRDRAAYEIVMKKDANTKVVLLVDNDGTVLKSKTKPM